MIDPTPRDIGRRVTYWPRDRIGATDAGTITSFNERWVFVRYDGRGETPQATSRAELQWAP